MDALVWEAEPPELRSPVLVCAFAGWNDAAGAATTALTTAAESLDAELIAQVDPEEFFDFQANRPTISLTEGQAREIEWPGNVLLAADAAGGRARPRAARRHRAEPALAHLLGGIADAAESLGVEMVITLGALIADVAHTLPVPITGLASDEDLVDELGLPAPTTRARPGSSACSTTPAAGAASARPASGPRCPTTSPPSPTRRRPWPCCAGSRA